jgi:DNA polymerase I-like protein with 3'-5' exonuclease and polymerase domains
MFKADPGHFLIDVDLSGADAQVVAWDAGDERLKTAFKKGLKVHIQNAIDIWGDEFLEIKEKKDVEETNKVENGPWTKKYATKYYEIKRAVHGTNYGGSARALSAILGWSLYTATEFQRKWFRTHPEIEQWHRRTEAQLQTQRQVVNAFGFRRPYFDRIDGLLPQALAWVPQSTIAINCALGCIQVRRALPWVRPRLQVHDSGIFSIPNHKRSELWKVHEYLKVTIPYPDPLTIQWELKTSSTTWGAAKKEEWPPIPEGMKNVQLPRECLLGTSRFAPSPSGALADRSLLRSA